MRSKADRKQFAAALSATFTLYGQAITDDVIRLWWNVLDGYRIDAVLSALSYHVADYHGFGHRLPTPADVRKHLEVTLPKLAAEAAQPVLERYYAEIAGIDESARVVAFQRRAGLIGVDVAMAHLQSLSEAKRAILNDPEYVAARRPLQVHEEEATTAAVPRNWVPPFLRRGIALLTGRS